MALLRKSETDLPSDAVILSKEDALQYQWKIVKKWPKITDVWALRYGPGILGAASAISGMYINGFYRGRMKLGSYGKLSSYLPIVVLPAIMSSVYHNVFIQPDIILSSNTCSGCIEVRAGICQAAFGVAYPGILAPLASFVFASRHFTYRLPVLTENPKEVFLLWRKLSKPLGFAISVAFACHAILGMLISYSEMKNILTVQSKLLKMEQDMEHTYS